MSKALADNFLWDERVDSDRLKAYEAGLPPFERSVEGLREAHGFYLNGAVLKNIPETFRLVNRRAMLPSEVWSEKGQNQLLVRVECLDYALTHTLISSVADLEHNLAVYQGEIKDEAVSKGEAKAFLEKLCDALNNNPHSVRPRFAAFAQELQHDIEAANWAERLRDRLGLAHMPPKRRSGPWPVALMRYKVAETVEWARRIGADFPLSVPTVLDSEPYEIFHPAPYETQYGRSLHLGDNDSCDQMASEVLHPRIEYTPSHIWKVGVIGAPVDTTDERLVRLRETHLFCLRYTSDRDDFGLA